jgi:hypothetical protein
LTLTASEEQTYQAERECKLQILIPQAAGSRFTMNRLFAHSDLVPQMLGRLRGSSARDTALSKQIAEAKSSQKEHEISFERRIFQLMDHPSGSAEGDAATESIIDEEVKLRLTIEEQLKLSRSAIEELYKSGDIEYSPYISQVREILSKQAKLFASDVTLERNREHLLAHIGQAVRDAEENKAALARNVATLLKEVIQLRTNSRGREQKQSRRDSIFYYHATSPKNMDFQGYPIFKLWVDRKVVHPAPLALIYV